MWQTTVEGSAKVYVPVQEVVDKTMDVFYNPVMRTNRDFSIIFLTALQRNNLKIGSPLAGSGVREIRMLKELPDDKVKVVYVNDFKADFVEYFDRNCNLSDLSEEQKAKLRIFNLDANLMVEQTRPFDYIDIDPFGTPNPFLDSAVRSLKHNGVIAVTATDTSALCGSYPAACMRKYWAKPLRTEMMHEFGLRILIRKVQMVAAQHKKALTPVFSYAKAHYMRVFFICSNSRNKADDIVKYHDFYTFEEDNYGPVWTSALNDLNFLISMRAAAHQLFDKDLVSKDTVKLFEMILNETEVNAFGFHDVHAFARKLKLETIPRFEMIIMELQRRGYRACRTHFSDKGIKTNASYKEFEDVLISLIETKK